MWLFKMQFLEKLTQKSLKIKFKAIYKMSYITIIIINM